jgi:hypothetical protein
MRFDDLIKQPAKPQKPKTYTESLQAKLDAEMAVKPAPKFTALEYAMMEGGHSLEESYGETFGQASQEKTNIMRNHNIKPGDEEWFKLWFGLPYMTGEKQSIKNENFADGKNPQDKGDSKRHGINTKASVSSLRKTAKQGGRKGQLAHWLANMKAGRAKKK